MNPNQKHQFRCLYNLASEMQSMLIAYETTILPEEVDKFSKVENQFNKLLEEMAQTLARL